MPESAFARGAAASAPETLDTTNRKNMLLLIQLRWIAVVGQIVTIAVTEFVLGITLPLGSMAIVLGVRHSLVVLALKKPSSTCVVPLPTYIVPEAVSLSAYVFSGMTAA